MRLNKFVQINDIILLITYTITRICNTSMISFHQYLFRVLMIILDFFIDTYHCDNGYCNDDDAGFRAESC